jgi:nitrite reductase (NADH) large subunit
MASERWCCTVCGYLHLGEAAPDCCPVCGATPELFEACAVPPAPAPVKSAPSSWRCMNCDHIHQGAAPPDCCPVCGVGPDQFEPVAEQKPGVAGQALAGSIVIVGGGIAGLSAAEAARSAAPEASVTLICQEDELPYYRLNLTRYLAGEIAARDLPVHPSSWYAEQRIAVLSGVEVTALNPSAGSISLKRRPDLSYDRLVLAMGAHPSVPPLPGADRDNVVTLRTLRDAEAILEKSGPGTSCVIIGGGVLGLEAAAALARRGVKVTLMEGFDWLLPRQLSRAAGERLAAEVVALGIGLVCGAKVKELLGDRQVRSVLLETGEELPAGLVIIATGVRSNSYLARLAGLEVDSGVVVDQHLCTSAPGIYAAGDLAEHLGMVYGTWAPAQFQGTIAGMNAAGGSAVFAGIPRSNSIKVLGVDLFSIGLVHPDDASYQVYEEDKGHYQQYVFRDSHLVGAVLVGDTALAPALKKLIETGTSCAALLAGATGAREIRAGIAALA